MESGLKKALVGEFLGTFLLVLIGVGSCVYENAGGGLGAAGIGFFFGLSVALAVLIFGKWSGAHINPAVSVAFVLTGHLERRKLLPYTVAQCAGALAASGLHTVIWPEVDNYGVTGFEMNWTGGFALEFGLTALLMGSIYWAIATAKRSRHVALVAGCVVGLEAWLAGPLCGASMNPVRSLSPAIVSGDCSQLWVYLIATTLGAAVIALAFKPKPVA